MKTRFGKLLSVFVLFVFVAQFSIAQKDLKEGQIVYEMINFNAENVENVEDASMGTSFTYSFSKTSKAIEMYNTLIQLKIINKYKTQSNSSLLVNLLGTRYEVTDIDKKEMNFASFLSIDSISSVKYLKNEKKTIKDYPCYRAELTLQNGKIVEMYITEKLKSRVSDITNFSLKGFPLEITTTDPDDRSKSTLRVKEINRSYGEAFVVPEGYEKITWEEFQTIY